MSKSTGVMDDDVLSRRAGVGEWLVRWAESIGRLIEVLVDTIVDKEALKAVVDNALGVRDGVCDGVLVLVEELRSMLECYTLQAGAQVYTYLTEVTATDEREHTPDSSRFPT